MMAIREVVVAACLGKQPAPCEVPEARDVSDIFPCATEQNLFC